jgi:hypothetical protein
MKTQIFHHAKIKSSKKPESGVNKVPKRIIEKTPKVVLYQSPAWKMASSKAPPPVDPQKSGLQTKSPSGT